MTSTEIPATPPAQAKADLCFEMTLNELKDHKEPENIICTIMMQKWEDVLWL